MSENKRPAAEKVTLPGKDGKTVTCTIKTPKLKTVREFRVKQRSISLVNGDYNKSIDALNEAKRVSDSVTYGEDDAAIKEAKTQLDAAQKECDERDEKLFDAMVDSFLSIVNISKGKSEEEVAAEDIDFDEVEIGTIQKAIAFFGESFSL